MTPLGWIVLLMIIIMILFIIYMVRSEKLPGEWEQEVKNIDEKTDERNNSEDNQGQAQ